MAVLPFVASWTWLKGLRGKFGRMDVRRGLEGLRAWQRKWRWRQPADTIGEAAVSSSWEREGEVEIEVFSTIPPTEAEVLEATNLGTALSKHSSPPSTQNREHRLSLLPSSGQITAYTLSSPQTLRRAVDQAREIYRDLDSRRREVGKKRGEGELVKGLMKKRVQEMEEQRGKGKSIVPPTRSANIQRTTMKATTGRSILPDKPLEKKTQARTSGLSETQTTNTGRTRTISDKTTDDVVNQRPKVMPARGRTRTATARTLARPVTSAPVNVPTLPKQPMTGVSGTQSRPHPNATEDREERNESLNIDPASVVPAFESNEATTESNSVLAAFQAPGAYPTLEHEVLALPSPSNTYYPVLNNHIGLGFENMASREDVRNPASTYLTSVRHTPLFPGGYPSTSFESPIAALRARHDMSVNVTPRPAHLPSIATYPPNVRAGFTVDTSASGQMTPGHLGLLPPGSFLPREESHTPVPARPQLRKNNSLGLIGTLDAMRSPSLEPTNTQTSIPGLSPFSESPRIFPSRLRQDMNASIGTGRSHLESTLDAPGSTGENAGHWAHGVYMPVLPLPAITPLSSPSIPQRRKPSVGDIYRNEEGQLLSKQHQATTSTLIPDREGPGTTDRQLPSSNLAEEDFSMNITKVPSSSNVHLTAVTGETKSAETKTKRPTRAVRPAVARKPELTMRSATSKVTRSSASRATSLERTTGKIAETTSETITKGNLRGRPAKATTTTDSSNHGTTAISASDPASTSVSGPTGIPSRKRKNPPVDKSAPQAINASRAPGRAQRAVRPTNTAVDRKTEFVLPKGVISAVAPKGASTSATETSLPVVHAQTPTAKKQKVESDMYPPMVSSPPQTRKSAKPVATRRSLRARESKN
ncbi:hypothetical protein QFC19_001765 [Naganishia cerealis]|uniref:Uncharacterized protein n=1 Tax=Naganishia cerealis TaxID=610337 RepID=A0ACC2WEA1_9TREE|nr:hypothetical protein QFC19_001765 [Naganishia cerealis]